MIGGWELATEPGRLALNRRLDRIYARARRNQDTRASRECHANDLRSCPRCHEFYPGLTYCPCCGEEVTDQIADDQVASRGWHALEVLALVSSALLLFTVFGLPLSLASLYLLLPGVLGAGGLALYAVLRNLRLARLVAEHQPLSAPDLLAGRTPGVVAHRNPHDSPWQATASTPARRTPKAARRHGVLRGLRRVTVDGDTWFSVLLLITALILPPATYAVPAARKALRTRARGQRHRISQVQTTSRTPEHPSPSVLLPVSPTEGDDEFCPTPTGRLLVQAPYPGGRETEAEVVVDGVRVGTTPWEGELDARLVTVEVGGIAHEVMIPECDAALVLELQPVEVPDDWVVIPGGVFSIGPTGDPTFDFPRHQVTVRSFRMWRTEVTVAQYRACVDAGACERPMRADERANWSWPERVDHPINQVTWHDAVDFCSWAGGRLPSESEWEYAARGAGRDIAYPWGDRPATCDLTVMDDGGPGCGRGGTWEVCSRPEGNSAQSLCDMSGNVWEWVRDSYSYWYFTPHEFGAVDGEGAWLWLSSYCPPEPDLAAAVDDCDCVGLPLDGSAWECDHTFHRVVRGGSFLSSVDSDDFVHPFFSEEVGFRCAS